MTDEEAVKLNANLAKAFGIPSREKDCYCVLCTPPFTHLADLTLCTILPLMPDGTSIRFTYSSEDGYHVGVLKSVIEPTPKFQAWAVEPTPGQALAQAVDCWLGFNKRAQAHKE